MKQVGQFWDTQLGTLLFSFSSSYFDKNESISEGILQIAGQQKEREGFEKYGEVTDVRGVHSVIHFT